MTIPAAPDAGASSPPDPPAATATRPAGTSPDTSPAGTAAEIAPPTAVRTSRRVWQWVARGVALVALAITVMVIALSIGMRANDADIDENLGSATASVISLSPLRTGIEFVDITGATIRPDGGVLYPGLLALGQQFVVEYSIEDPQIARVAGRTAAVGTPLIAITQLLTVLLSLPLIWWCLRRAGLPLIGLRRGPGHASHESLAPSRALKSPKPG